MCSVKASHLHNILQSEAGHVLVKYYINFLQHWVEMAGREGHSLLMELFIQMWAERVPALLPLLWGRLWAACWTAVSHIEKKEHCGGKTLFVVTKW